MRKKQFLKNTLIMSFTAIAARFMGLWFRSFLTGRVGTEGIGIYQLILTVYAFSASVTVSGASLAVTRLVSEQRAKGRYELSKTVVRKCLVFSEVTAFILCTLLFVFSDIISVRILGEARCSSALRILAVSLPFMSFSACLRGYFTALRKVVPTAAEQLLEQLTEIVVCIMIFSALSPKNAEEACIITAVGTLSAEVISFLYSFLLYIIDTKRTESKSKHKNIRHDTADKNSISLKRIMSIAMPVTANSALRSGLSAVENILIPIGLLKYGADSSTALSHYGILTGLAMPVITFPMVFVIPASALLVPEISEAAALGHQKAVRRMTVKMIKCVLLYSVPLTVLIMLFSGQIGEFMFHSSDAGKYIAALSPVIPLMCLDSAADGILKGLNLQTSYLAINTADSIMRILFTWILIPILGPLGAAGIIVFSELFNVTLSLMGCFRSIGFGISHNTKLSVQN